MNKPYFINDIDNFNGPMHLVIYECFSSAHMEPGEMEALIAHYRKSR